MPVDLDTRLGVTDYDDDANFHRNYVLKYAMMRPRVPAPASLETGITPSPSYQDISLEDQEKLNRSSHQSEQELNGDLLAIESSDESRRLSSTLSQHHQVRSPPYALHEQFKTNHSVFREPLQAVEPEQHSNDGKLLKLHRTSASVPIYLRHPLPSSVTRPQIIAFEHPASLRKQSESTSHNPHGYSEVNSEPASGRATFALLPSWPKIYIAQREKPHITKYDGTHQSEQDPKVPSIYPNWSTHNGSDEQIQTTDSSSSARQHLLQQSDYDQKVGESGKKSASLDPSSSKVNLTASEVEYEETPNNRDATLQGEKSQESAEWAKLLRQAAKSDVMESIMLTNKSIVSLLCDSDNMLVRFKFRQPFHGLVETNLDPNEHCRLFGNGSHFYEMRIDLYGCGTRQEMPSLFINNLQIQYQNPFLLIRSRLELLKQQQQAAHSDQLSDVEELKTIICSYPIEPRAHVPARGQLDLSSNDLTTNHTDRSLSDLFKQSAATNLSDRIIEVPGQDAQNTARLFYYEPVLLISGLLLLTIACTLALITSAYLVRRRHQKMLSRSSSTIRDSSHLSADDRLSRSPMGIYDRSPAQMANERYLVAPPLIALSREESLRVRPSIKQYPYSNTKELRQKQHQRASSYSITTKKDYARLSGQPATQQQPNQPSTTTETGDSLDSRTRGDRSSVTTIDVPYVGQSRPEISSLPSDGTSAKRKLDRDETIKSDLRGREEVRSFTKYKQIKRQESIIETSYRDESKEASNVAKTDRACCTEQKRQSPIPFGSFRSKLTSPREFKRLENIKRLFEQSADEHDPASSLSRLRMRICRSLSESERLTLIEMLSSDEVFRSNILDSIDRQTFSRKLRDNSNYSDRLSAVAWKLLEEILLQIDVDRLICGGQKFECEEVNELLFAPVKGQSQKCAPSTRTHSQLNQSTSSHDLDSRGALRKNDPSTGPTSRQENRSERDNNSVDAPRVSQSNSTSTRRVPSGTLVNMDSVTNITTPRNTTAYSSSFQQTTRYEETHNAADDSLPYMDELSQNSIGTQSWSSLERQYRKQRQKQ